MPPTSTVPNDRLVVESVTGVCPVPETLTVCGLFPASSVIASVAVRVPLALGVKVTLMVQLPPDATLLPQVFVCPKSPAFAPVKAMLPMFSVTLESLVSVTACGALVVPMDCEAKVRLVGETETPPHPESLKFAIRVNQLIG